MMLTHDLVAAVLAEHAASSDALGRGLSLAICDAQGFDLFAYRGAGAAWFTARVAASKARTAAVYDRTTVEFAAFRERVPEVVALGDEAIAFTPTGLGGGVPVRRDGRVLAGVGISGATPEQDAEVAERIAAILAAAPEESR